MNKNKFSEKDIELIHDLKAHVNTIHQDISMLTMLVAGLSIACLDEFHQLIPQFRASSYSVWMLRLEVSKMLREVSSE